MLGAVEFQSKGLNLQKKVCVISLSDLKNDPRVYRQIDLLKSCFRVDTVGYQGSGISGVRHCRVKVRRNTLLKKFHIYGLSLLRQFERMEKAIKGSYSYPASDLKNEGFDLIIANDIEALPMALEIRNGGKLLFDAHEYAPREFEDLLAWRVFFQGYRSYLCRRYLGEVDEMTTVNGTISVEYEKHFNVRSTVITNATTFCDIEPSPVHSDVFRMIHHGGAIPSRKIELMIELMDRLDERFTLDLMLVPTDGRYFRKLLQMCSTRRNVIVREPVPMADIVKTINAYDIGLFYLEPVNYNYLYALPNKIFEFIQARLAIAIGPSPEMAQIVRRYDCGVVSDSFSVEDLASKMKHLTTERVEYYKTKAHGAARELSLERNSIKMKQIINGMVDRQNGMTTCAE